MPEMGGHELAAALARLNPGVKIIFISGATNGSNLAGLPPGCPLIAKPFSVERLIASVHQALGTPSAG